MTRRTLVGLALVLLVGVPASAGAPADPLPRGARRLEDDLYASPRGFRDTVAWYRKELDRRGLNVVFTPVERSRDVTFTRILSQEAATSWSAIHIGLAEGKTLIYIVRRTRGSSNGRT